MRVTPSTVVCKAVWGIESYTSDIEPIVIEHALTVAEKDTTEDGIGVTFATMRDAVIFRLFYNGDTLTE
jgi:hypothetical protein